MWRFESPPTPKPTESESAFYQVLQVTCTQCNFWEACCTSNIWKMTEVKTLSSSVCPQSLCSSPSATWPPWWHQLSCFPPSCQKLLLGREPEAPGNSAPAPRLEARRPSQGAWLALRLCCPRFLCSVPLSGFAPGKQSGLDFPFPAAHDHLRRSSEFPSALSSMTGAWWLIVLRILASFFSVLLSIPSRFSGEWITARTKGCNCWGNENKEL